MNPRIKTDIQELSHEYPVSYDDVTNAIAVHGVRLLRGYTPSSIDIMIEIPSDYPLSPPGVGGTSIYLPDELRYRGQEIEDLHPRSENRFNRQWAWFCYEHIDWNPLNDKLITLLGRIQADLDGATQKHSGVTLAASRQRKPGMLERLSEWLDSR